MADGVADGGLAAVTDVQRPGGVGGDELHQDFLAARRLVAILRALRQHLVHHLLLGGGLEADVQKTGAGDLDGLHPFLERGRGLQRGL